MNSPLKSKVAEPASLTIPCRRCRRIPLRSWRYFRCLLGNACKFRGEASPVVHVGAAQDAGEWTFSVRDNGIGFDPAYSTRIFRPFERLNGKTISRAAAWV